jgi:D-3-phosphoglycerate dehydrogenase / 2-oxoglutarate reductase
VLPHLWDRGRNLPSAAEMNDPAGCAQQPIWHDAAMKVLIADKLASFVPGRLQDLGSTPIVVPTLAGTALSERLAADDPEVLVVRSTQVTADNLAAAPSLALVVRAGSGVNTIDVAAASGRGVYVTNCPGKNAAAVAELTFAHLLNLDRRLADSVIALREGRWQKKVFGSARGLAGRTLAVLGCGTIGREVIRRARAFGMPVVGWSRSLDEAGAAELGIGYASTPERAVERADAVTIHLALTSDTRGRIGESVFSAMKRGAWFVNTARGELVDEEALLRAVREKDIRAGLDVFAEEPQADGPFESVLAAEANVYGSHHVGASTQEAEDAVGEEVVRIIAAYASGAPIPNCVNLARKTNATHTLVVRHADRVGVLAHILDALREAGHNVEDMQNIVFSGSSAACARIAIVGAPHPDVLGRVAAHDDIFSVTANPA